MRKNLLKSTLQLEPFVDWMNKAGHRINKINGENDEVISEEEYPEEQEQIGENSLPFLSMLTQALAAENISNQEDMDGLT